MNKKDDEDQTAELLYLLEEKEKEIRRLKEGIGSLLELVNKISEEIKQ